MTDKKKLLITVFMSLGILFIWHHFHEKPRIDAAESINEQRHAHQESQKSYHNFTDRDTIITQTKEFRLPISSSALSGSIQLRGFRIDDLKLLKYRDENSPSSPPVVLLSPAGAENAYFSTFGWVSGDKSLILPDHTTIWKADKEAIRPNEPVTLTWNNGQGLAFAIRVTLDKNYMFKVTQHVENRTDKPIQIMPFGLINKLPHETSMMNTILHEGPIGVFGGALSEFPYKDIKDGKKDYHRNENGWLGITDKYWLTAIIPTRNQPFDASFAEIMLGNRERVQADYLGEYQTVSPSKRLDLTTHFFAGAKEVHLLDEYAKKLNIPLFDRAVDFGWFYFLTKPMFIVLAWIYKMVGNFGAAILLMTVIIKLIMFPLANKQYVSMSKMKAIQPQINQLKERYKDDRAQFNHGLMAIYKRESINPLSGCLPILIQIPVLFSLYKVLFVTIEMRHAPFFGWIHDLSAPDPTSVFNLFGILPWTPPSFLEIGLWPLILGITMYVQQMLNPQPSDPAQAKAMRLLPLIFIVMFHAFPAGLIIYWSWGNLLSMTQQWFINRRYN